MHDFLETPVGEFDWGPTISPTARLRRWAPTLATTTGIVLMTTGLLWLIRG